MAKGSSNRKWGRNERKCKAYRVGNKRERSKIKKVLQSSGLEEAHAWARHHGKGITVTNKQKEAYFKRAQRKKERTNGGARCLNTTH